MDLKDQDKPIADLIASEYKRQKEGLELIPSENYISPAVREALSSVFTDKYSEGYPGKRYYGGNEFVDELENLAISRARTLFGVPHANVQPYSGAPANLAVYVAVCNPGDRVMGLNLPDGGHLSHGWKVSVTAQYYESHPYHVTREGRIDFDEVYRLARELKPKLMWAGATAYSYSYDFSKFAAIADEVGAYFAADIAHVAGLVVAGVHPSPVPYAHIVTTTTHKTLRGPRGAMILVTQKGLDKDADLAKKIDKAVFPGLQGGPHDHQTAGIAVALGEASTHEFSAYARQIVVNAKALATTLLKHDITLVGGGTENHLLLADLTDRLGPGGGVLAQDALGAAGITVNKNTVPGEQSSPFYPSGVRMGTPAITTRGMGEAEMGVIGAWIAEIIGVAGKYRLPSTPEERRTYLTESRAAMASDASLADIRSDVRSLCSRFPLP